jgi:hypothetical protein
LLLQPACTRAIAQATIAPKSTEKPVVVEKSPEPQSPAMVSTESSAKTEPAIFPKEEIDEDAHKQFDKIANQPCDRQTKDEKATRYMICSVKGADGNPRIISASSAHKELGDGVGYWFRGNGEVVAIRYFHTGTALCANLKPRENFESGASRRFQNFLCTPQSLNRL